MKTINIKGKEYITVNERLKEFRNNFKDYSLTTEIIELGQDNCTMKATITDDKGVVRATGFAREVIAKSPINKFAFVENCETSAIGRALGNFGIGIDTAICTADELLMKLAQETNEKTPAQKAQETRAKNKATKEEVEVGAKKAMEWALTQADNSIEIYSEDWKRIDKMETLLREWNSDLLQSFLDTVKPKIKPDQIPF
jgi:hypothetical protein